MSSPKVILEAKNIGKRFTGVIALDDVDLQVHSAKVNVVVGENGAGKSTLMKILSGVYSEYTGQVFLDGKVVRFNNPKEALEAGIAIIHQELNLIPYLSVTENIFLGNEMVTSMGLLNDRAMHKTTVELLARLESTINPRTKVAELRVGEQQLVEIAKALSVNARVIIMDEPTSAISDSEVETLFKIIDGLIKEGVAILYISHKLDELFKIADRFIALRDGKMVGTLEEPDKVSKEDLIELMIGREVKNRFKKQETSFGDEVLRVEDICLAHPVIRDSFLVKDVGFNLKIGEVLGIFGLMGAGRTELFEAIFGVHGNRTTGKIFVDGKQQNIKSIIDAIAAGMALVPEDRKEDGLVLNMNVAQNIGLASIEQTMANGFLNDKAEASLAQEYIEKMNIKTSSHRQEVGKLSGGNQQKVVIGKWLATDPKVLLLDEPTRGIDVGAKNEIYHLIDQLAKAGLAVVVASSELPEIMAISDKIMVLSESKVTAMYNIHEASEARIMAAAIQ